MLAFNYGYWSKSPFESKDFTINVLLCGCLDDNNSNNR